MNKIVDDIITSLKQNNPIAITEDLDEFINALDKSKISSSKRSIFSKSYEKTGTLGQYAVSKILDIPFDFNIYYGGDKGIDMVYKKIAIQVKATTYPPSKMKKSHT